jgi:hypothetical protein
MKRVLIFVGLKIVELAGLALMLLIAWDIVVIAGRYEEIVNIVALVVLVLIGTVLIVAAIRHNWVKAGKLADKWKGKKFFGLFLLLALAFCQARAQETIGWVRIHPDTVTYTPASDLQIMAAGNIGAFLELYSRYERDCWNDSTSLGRGMWLSDMGHKWWFPLERNLLDTSKFMPEGWEHRQATFEGFISWLRKRK